MEIQEIFADHQDAVLRMERETGTRDRETLLVEMQGGTMTCEDIEKIIDGLRSLEYFEWKLTITWQS